MDDAPPIPPTWRGLMNRMAQASDPDVAWDQFVAFTEHYYNGQVNGIKVHGTPVAVHRIALAQLLAMQHAFADWAPGLIEPFDRVRATLDRIMSIAAADRGGTGLGAHVAQSLSQVTLQSLPSLEVLPNTLGLLDRLVLAEPERAALEQAHAELREAARLFDAAAGEPVIGELRALRRVRLNHRELTLG